MGTTPSSDAPTAVRALRCFEELALEHGLDDVSMRDVAKRLGISLAALQYHYATKAQLVDAFVESVIDVHRERLRAAQSSAGGDDRFGDALRYVVAANADDADGAGLMSMIWARAAHDEGAAVALDRFMGAYLEWLTEAVGREFPDLAPTQRVTAAAITVALLEGLEDVRRGAVSAGVDSEELTATAMAVASRLPEMVLRGS
ncbi:MAG: TetR/AcrR family transcriptional regulator [Actinomycetota bacterium]